jgi:hypothetical protein
MGVYTEAEGAYWPNQSREDRKDGSPDLASAIIEVEVRNREMALSKVPLRYSSSLYLY